MNGWLSPRSPYFHKVISGHFSATALAFLHLKTVHLCICLAWRLRHTCTGSYRFVAADLS